MSSTGCSMGILAIFLWLGAQDGRRWAKAPERDERSEGSAPLRPGSPRRVGRQWPRSGRGTAPAPSGAEFPGRCGRAYRSRGEPGRNLSLAPIGARSSRERLVATPLRESSWQRRFGSCFPLSRPPLFPANQRGMMADEDQCTEFIEGNRHPHRALARNMGGPPDGPPDRRR